MKVKFKKLHNTAKIPTKAHENDAGFDFYSINRDYENGSEVHQTGIALEIPKGYVGLIFPRSSIASKCLVLSNSVGVIDSNYRGQILFKFKEIHKPALKYYEPGDKIGQLLIIPYPQIELEEVNELSSSERGTDGFGSTGK